MMQTKSEIKACPEQTSEPESSAATLCNTDRYVKAGCVIAAAGLSSRMGKLKPLLPLGTETILRTGILTMKKAGADPVVVVTGNEKDAVEASIADLSVETVFNPEYAVCQMFDSVKLGLRQLSGRCDRILFAPGDAPLYSADTIRSLLQCEERICAPFQDGKFGHPVCFDAGLLDQILQYEGDGGLAGALRSLGGITAVPCADPGAYLDADTPDDYETMKRVLMESGR